MNYDAGEVSIGQLYLRYVNFDLAVDSRQVSQYATTLYFALAGVRRDGASFLPELVGKGVRHFVVSKIPILDASLPLNCILTARPVELLQDLASFHRGQLTPRAIVAITGSNGKTIVKDWLAQLAGASFATFATPRSYNSQIGVPLSIWRLREHHEVAIIEAGISHPGEMAKLTRIIQPNGGVLTNIGTAHLDNFASRDQLIAEKLSLFDSVDWLLVNREELGQIPEALLPAAPKIVCWSGSGSTGLQIDDDAYPLTFPTLPAIYLLNARTAAAAAIQLGIEPVERIQKDLRHLLPLTNRLEQRQGRDGGVVINDSYSNDFSALAAALAFAETQDQFGQLTLILGTVQPLPDLGSRLAALFQGRVTNIYLTGKSNQELATLLPAANYYPETQEFLAALPYLNFTKQTVIVKGASYENFGQIADRLSLQQHRTTLTIDLNAIEHNLTTYRNLLPQDCKMLVMAKASAYGSGALPVARLLQAMGADHLSVAYLDEGIALRRGGIFLPILVLNAEPSSYASLAEHDLQPAIHSIEQFRIADRLGLSMHLEIDTGMGRLGFSPGEFQRHLPNLLSPNVKAIFTHLAASEDAAHDDFSRKQIKIFDGVFNNYIEGGGARVRRHVLNSNGIGRFPQATYEMVRLGIGLFGIGDEAQSQHLRPALRLRATISSIGERRSGETIGYGRRGRVVHDNSRIAVVSIGYADGLPRSAGEGRFTLLVRGRYAPTIGSICMDMCMVDITEIPEARIGDQVTVFGPEHPVELLALAADTIPYEILTGVGSRVHRIYIGE